uniref:Uncharacterized protein n=1 Tax=Opuntia streptacantha TaxID=393608 RepID=A0A7C9DL93_OPUST
MGEQSKDRVKKQNKVFLCLETTLTKLGLAVVVPKRTQHLHQLKGSVQRKGNGVIRTLNLVELLKFHSDQEKLGRLIQKKDKRVRIIRHQLVISQMEKTVNRLLKPRIHQRRSTYM